MKKKVIAMCLVVAAMCSFVLPAMALEVSDSLNGAFEAKQMITNHTGDSIVESGLLETVQADVELLSQACLKDGIQIYELKPSGNVVYEYAVSEDTTDYIEVQKNHNGDIILNIEEGEINNELVYKDDGRVFLDGHEVVV